MQTMNLSATDAKQFAILGGLVAIATAIFWMVVGWRAMRAHERLADAFERAVQKFQAGDK